MSVPEPCQDRRHDVTPDLSPDADEFFYEGADPDRLQRARVSAIRHGRAARHPMLGWTSFLTSDDKSVRAWLALVEAYTNRYLRAEFVELWEPLFEELEATEDDNPFDDTRNFNLPVMTDDEREREVDAGHQLWQVDIARAPGDDSDSDV